MPWLVRENQGIRPLFSEKLCTKGLSAWYFVRENKKLSTKTLGLGGPRVFVFGILVR